MNALEKLLENYWFVRNNNQQEYEKVRNELDEETQNFIKQKLGYKIIINPYIIKLEKIPGKPQAFMGIKEFSDKLEYVCLCLVLIYLEEKSRGEQFILSELIDYIQNSILEIEMLDVSINFNLYSHRKSMVKVLKHSKDLGFIRLYDGDENEFAKNIENDVLYEVTGVSKYFVRNFTSNISDCNQYIDIYKKEQLGLEQDKGIERRQRIYRRVFTENVIYSEEVNDQDYAYIKNYKNTINQDVDKMLDSSFEVHKNGAYILLVDSKNYKNTFPGNKAISDVILFVNYELKQSQKRGDYEVTIEDKMYLSELEFIKTIQKVKEKYSKGFSKEYREMEEKKLIEEIVTFMKEFDMLRYEKEKMQYVIMPIAFKITGVYPEKFIEVTE